MNQSSDITSIARDLFNFSSATGVPPCSEFEKILRKKLYQITWLGPSNDASIIFFSTQSLYSKNISNSKLSSSSLHHSYKAPTTLNQPNFTNWTPLKPTASSSFGATAPSTNNSSSPANENNNTLTTEDKLAKQNVKYDMSTGKVYEELGASSGNPALPVVASPTVVGTNCNTRTRSTLDYTAYGQQSYQSTGSYPYGNYMSSFGSPYATSPGSYPYDRSEHLHTIYSFKKEY